MRFDVDETGRGLLATLLSLPSERYSSIDLTPQKRKAETISLLANQLEALADEAPVLVVLEDAHWIDHSTRELFDEITECMARTKILLVVTRRPEFSSPWTTMGHVTQIMLNHLGRQEVSSLVKSVAGRRSLPKEVLQQIIDKTDGVPLFATPSRHSSTRRQRPLH